MLEQEGLIKKGSRGVGFGVGKDPIVAFLASKGCELLATDLDLEKAKKSGWVHTNQFSKSLSDLNEKGITSDEVLKKQVHMRSVDMNNIPEDIQDYDFTWSACAFEHLGSLQAGLDFVENSLKCLKPGGVAVHTTEYNISSNEDTIESGHTVIYRKKEIEALAQKLKNQGHEIELNLNYGDGPMDLFYDVPPYSDYTHLKLKMDKYIITSIGLKIRKKL